MNGRINFSYLKLTILPSDKPNIGKQCYEHFIFEKDCIELYLRPWQTRKHCCITIIVSPFACARNICCGRISLLRPRRKKCFWILSETFCVRNKCFPVCSPKHLRPQQCFRNNVSSFATAFKSTRVSADIVFVIIPPHTVPSGTWPETQKLFVPAHSASYQW